MDDIRISTALPHHPKMKRLEQKLGAAGFSAFVKLLCWVGDNRPDGNLRGLNDEDLELAVNWIGSKSLVKVLVDVGFIDGKVKRRLIHDWTTHQPYVATRPQRIEKARAAAIARWEGVAPDERSKQAKKAAEARWHEPRDASGMHAPSTHEPDNSKKNAVFERQSDACAEYAECVPSPLPYPTHARTPRLVPFHLNKNLHARVIIVIQIHQLQMTMSALSPLQSKAKPRSTTTASINSAKKFSRSSEGEQTKSF